MSFENASAALGVLGDAGIQGSHAGTTSVSYTHLIYRKRFGLSKEKVQSIMDGDEGCDGTDFDAQQAVEAGIIPVETILKTSQQVAGADAGWRGLHGRAV